MNLFIEKEKKNQKLSKSRNFKYHCHYRSKKTKSCSKFCAWEHCLWPTFSTISL